MYMVIKQKYQNCLVVPNYFRVIFWVTYRISHCCPTYLTEMAMAPAIYMLETWLTPQEMATVTGYLLKCEPGR